MTRRFLLVLLAAGGCVVPPSGGGGEEFLGRADEQFLAQQYATAAGSYESFLAENPSHFRRAEVLGRIGKCQLALGRPEEAVRRFDQALEERPEPAVRADLLFRRAVALREAGDLRAALEGFRAAHGAPERDRAFAADELRYEYALALFRSGDWKGGHEQLAGVSPNGPFGTKKYTLQGLSSFTVQVGAFTDERNARAQADRLKATVRPVPTDTPLYIVTAGSFVRYEEARREADRLKRQGVANAFVIP